MAKKKGDQHSKAVSSIPPTPPVVDFPHLTPKDWIECRALLDDQILLVDVGSNLGFLSASECSAFVKCVDNLPWELTRPKRRGEADRVNHRFSLSSPEFAQKLHALLVPHLPSFPYPTSHSKASQRPDTRLPHSFNSNIRIYKYTPTQHFGPHYDDSVRDPATGAYSEWTLLIYLTGVEDGVEGGETLFYKDERGKSREVIAAPLTRGTALLHRHGQECMLHEGSPVRKGVKYVLRSDLMFTR